MDNTKKKLGIFHYFNENLKPIKGQHPIYVRITFERKKVEMKSPTYSHLIDEGAETIDFEKVEINDIRIFNCMRNFWHELGWSWDVKHFRMPENEVYYKSIETAHNNLIDSLILKFFEKNNLPETHFFLEIFDNLLSNFMEVLEELRPELFEQLDMTIKATQLEIDRILIEYSKHDPQFIYGTVADLLGNKELEDYFKSNHEQAYSYYRQLRESVLPDDPTKITHYTFKSNL